jgi:oxygen-independent coproporphyrinogen III oxidase
MAGIYIHIPFCKQACNYCDFHFSTSMKMKSSFVKALVQEIELRKRDLGKQVLSSIYIGGGSPSLLSSSELKVIFEKLKDCFTISSDAEITLEANPDDLTFEKIQDLKLSPINRLSIGVQSFRDEDLKFMNRAHSATEALQSISMCQEAGFNNLSIDLIYGTPGMTNEAWHANLSTCFSLNVPHVSSYALTVEENTALYHQIAKSKIAPVSEKQSAAQFEILMQEMDKQGYEQYEISNFCKPNSYSRHNSSYWKKDNYLGLGPSAHSFIGSKRLWNVSNNVKYIKSLSEKILPIQEEELSVQNQYNEYVMTSLRTIWGCSMNYLIENFSDELAHYFKEEVAKYVSSKDVKEVDGIYTLTPKGKLLADGIASDLFSVD